MKIIFLDFDGVIINKWSRFRCIDEHAVGHLNRICAESGARVVVSSNWRHIGLGRCRAMLKDAGFTGKTIGATPVLWGQSRGEEIAAWLARHPQVSHFVIIDDDDDMGALGRALVQTDRLAGLTNVGACLALGILREVPPRHGPS